MGLKPKFTEGEYYYEMDDDFLEDLESLPPLYSAAILMQLDNLAYDIYMEKSSEVKIKHYGTLGGVVPLSNPLFYSVQYIKKNNHPLFYKLNFINSDDYLDYINLNQVINYGTDTNKKPIN
jgi:hypothetical protein